MRDESACFWLGPDLRITSGPAAKRPQSKAEYMAAPDPLVEMSDFPLAPRAPSIHGTSRHFGAAQQSVAFGGTTDIRKVDRKSRCPTSQALSNKSQRMSFQPQGASHREWVVTNLLPPRRLITAAMKCAMVSATQRHSELIADLTPQRPTLGEA
jgi:hypothetical protein